MNKIILMGRLTRDPEVSSSKDGSKQFTRFSIAVNRRTKEEGVDYFNCTAFGKTGEGVAKYFGKGSRILVTGSMQGSEYTNKDGVKMMGWGVFVTEWEFVENKDKSQQQQQGYGNPQQQGYGNSQQNYGNPQQQGYGNPQQQGYGNPQPTYTNQQPTYVNQQPPQQQQQPPQQQQSQPTYTNQQPTYANQQPPQGNYYQPPVEATQNEYGLDAQAELLFE